MPPTAAGQRLDREGLGQAGDALEQAVAAGQQGDEHALDHAVLADDDPLDLEQHLLELGGVDRRRNRRGGTRALDRVLLAALLTGLPGRAGPRHRGPSTGRQSHPAASVLHLPEQGVPTPGHARGSPAR